MITRGTVRHLTRVQTRPSTFCRRGESGKAHVMHRIYFQQVLCTCRRQMLTSSERPPSMYSVLPGNTALLEIFNPRMFPCFFCCLCFCRLCLCSVTMRMPSVSARSPESGESINLRAGADLSPTGPNPTVWRDAIRVDKQHRTMDGEVWCRRIGLSKEGSMIDSE